MKIVKFDVITDKAAVANYSQSSPSVIRTEQWLNAMKHGGNQGQNQVNLFSRNFVNAIKPGPGFWKPGGPAWLGVRPFF